MTPLLAVLSRLWRLLRCDVHPLNVATVVALGGASGLDEPSLP